MVIIANSTKALHSKMEKLERSMMEYAIKINARKTKVGRRNGTQNMKVITKEGIRQRLESTGIYFIVWKWNSTLGKRKKDTINTYNMCVQRVTKIISD